MLIFPHSSSAREVLKSFVSDKLISIISKVGPGNWVAVALKLHSKSDYVLSMAINEKLIARLAALVSTTGFKSLFWQGKHHFL
jgi:hypothetical protein